MKLSVIDIELWLSAVVEIEDTVGAVVSIVKLVTVKVFPVFPELSVTFIVQL